MANDSSKSNWIEPPARPERGSGCFAKGCLLLLVLLLVVFAVATYQVVFRGSKPAKLPVQELPPEHLHEVQQRVDQFESMPPAATPTQAAPTATPVTQTETPTPTIPSESNSGRQLTLTATEINGLISANPKSRGHAFVSLSGNTATVEVSVPANKVPGFPQGGFVNGTFRITTDGPTPISALQVSKVEANGVPFPSGILSMSVNGRSILSYALEQSAAHNVSTAEIRDGKVILR
jgi:hypothetical protein